MKNIAADMLNPGRQATPRRQITRHLMKVRLQFKGRHVGSGLCRDIARGASNARTHIQNPRAGLQLQNLQRLINRVGPEIMILVKRRELVHPQCGIRPDTKGRQLVVNAVHIGIKFHGFHMGWRSKRPLSPQLATKGNSHQ